MNHRNLPRGSSQGCLELELERILLERIKNIAAMSQGNILLKVASPGSKIHLPEVYANDIKSPTELHAVKLCKAVF